MPVAKLFSTHRTVISPQLLTKITARSCPASPRCTNCTTPPAIGSKSEDVREHCCPVSEGPAGLNTRRASSIFRSELLLSCSGVDEISLIPSTEFIRPSFQHVLDRLGLSTEYFHPTLTTVLSAFFLTLAPSFNYLEDYRLAVM